MTHARRGTLRVMLAVAVLFMGWVAGCSSDAENRWPTPEMSRFEAIEVPGGVGYAMRAELGDTGQYVGLAVMCRKGASAQLEAGAFFGGFPGRHTPVQLAVRDAEGRVERFGPVVKAGRESGFHSPLLTEASEVRRFVGVALKPGSLISNGHRSFWNRVSEAENRRVLDAVMGCEGTGRDEE